MWLSGLEHNLVNQKVISSILHQGTCLGLAERSSVQFPIRAHAWVAGLVPGRGMYKIQLIGVFLLLTLPSLSKINKHVLG